MAYERTKQIHSFFNELAKVSQDGKMSFIEGVGLIPEGMGLIDAIKNYKELHKEMLELYDIAPNQLRVMYGIEQEHFEAIFDLCNSVLNCIETFKPKN